jgi:two-component system OmpR family response regulator
MVNLTVALVEDDIDLAEEIGFQLEHHGITVALFENGKALDNWLKENKCDVLLLDLNLPDEDGLSIAKRLSARQDLRIVMLTARVMTSDRIAGFDAGADVYLQKPVHLEELIAVIQQQERRLQKELPKNWQLKIAASLLITPEDETIKLTGSENRFLMLLALSENYYLTRIELENKLWRMSDIHTARRLEVLVSRLRYKLQKLNYELIQTYRGEGYGLMASLLL